MVRKGQVKGKGEKGREKRGIERDRGIERKGGREGERDEEKGRETERKGRADKEDRVHGESKYSTHQQLDGSMLRRIDEAAAVVDRW